MIVIIGIFAGIFSLLRPKEDINTVLDGNNVLNRNELNNSRGKLNAYDYGDSVLGGGY